MYQPKIREPTLYTAKETAQAAAHCIITIVTADFVPSSRFTAAIAATQGVYKSVNARKLAAERGEKIPESTEPRSETFEPVSTASVDTTASLAVKPVIRAVAARQSPKPRGLNMGAITIPSIASRLSELSEATLRRASKLCRNQMIIVAKNITVNALSRKSFALSHISIATLFADGRR